MKNNLPQLSARLDQVRAETRESLSALNWDQLGILCGVVKQWRGYRLLTDNTLDMISRLASEALLCHIQSLLEADEND